ncbi:hypothetical protein [Aurantimonas coralicida]|uniref:hypothetical protein n=1 Tax=Aurantimonas coralicida TaxID=182270 RepID=UPI0023870E78|nr:hypothetical protein [Aurantimonas coralicida]MDE0922524.1 hypothetical protein [Aurantimonas coralicida]
MSTVVATLPDRPRREIARTDDIVPILDTAKFEHMQRVANVMASTSMIPDALSMAKITGQRDPVPLPMEKVVANCFLVVNQAVRWGMDPFAVAQCVSVVHGKLCYEGKLVSAVLDAKLGLKLHHAFTGEAGKEDRRIFLSDEPFDAETIAELRPGFRSPDRRIFDGSVAEWKTTGTGTPWTAKNFDRMLIYRGHRDWCRIYEPAIMLGVYTPDEMLDLSENARANRARDVTQDRPSLADRMAAAKATGATQDKPEGFDRSFIEGELRGAPETATPEETASADEIGTHAGSETWDGAPVDGETGRAAEPDTLGSNSPESEANSPETGEQDTGDVDPDAPAAEHEDAVARSPMKLVSYARAMFLVAGGDGDAEKKLDRLEKTQERWRPELKDNLDEAYLKKAQSIFKSAQAVATDKADLDAACDHFSGLLGCQASEIMPKGGQ